MAGPGQGSTAVFKHNFEARRWIPAFSLPPATVTFGRLFLLQASISPRKKGMECRYIFNPELASAVSSSCMLVEAGAGYLGLF